MANTYCADLDSRNGTYISQRRRHEVQVTEVAIKLGTSFRVGGTRLCLVADGDADDADDLANLAAEVEVEVDVEVDADAEKAPAEKSKRRGWRFGRGRKSRQRDEGTADNAVQVAAAEPTDPVEALAHTGVDLPYGQEQIALINARGDTVHEVGEITQKQETAEAVRTLRLLLLGCIRTKASDMHVEPREGEAGVRLRVDGAMVSACQFDEDRSRRLMSLVKVLSDLDITRKGIVQEGHFTAETPDRRVDYRVSFTPAMYGQKLVLRVLDPMNSPRQLADLLLPAPVLKSLTQLAAQDTGMLLVSGPTGSGKTTTLYAMLREIDAQQRNVITIEDPIEYSLPGATQIPVDKEQGHTFGNLLRSVLRQDPDVIMLGEIRDAETATIAMQAATTGHLVLSTIHAQDTMGSIFRLRDLGVEPYLIGSTLNLVLAQRLARRLCPHCCQPRTMNDDEARRLDAQVHAVTQVYEPVGCRRCFGTGYAGRQGVFEMLHNTEAVRDVIQHEPNARDLRAALEGSQYQPLREAGRTLVREGITTLDEIDRVVGQ